MFIAQFPAAVWEDRIRSIWTQLFVPAVGSSGDFHARLWWKLGEPGNNCEKQCRRCSERNLVDICCGWCPSDVSLSRSYSLNRLCILKDLLLWDNLSQSVSAFYALRGISGDPGLQSRRHSTEGSALRQAWLYSALRSLLFTFQLYKTNGFRCWDFDLIDYISTFHWCYFTWTEWSLAMSPSFQILPMWTSLQKLTSASNSEVHRSYQSFLWAFCSSGNGNLVTISSPVLVFLQSKMFSSKILHMVSSHLAQLSSNLQASDNRPPVGLPETDLLNTLWYIL